MQRSVGRTIAPAAFRGLVLTFVCGAALLTLTAFAARPAQAQSYSVLHGFTNTPDGGNPNPLIRDGQGNIYGTTQWGGMICGGGGYTCGTMFKIDTAGNETVLYRFAGQGDGANSEAALVRDAAGNLYGTTTGNGSIPAVSTIFKVDPSGQETVLYRFDSAVGCCAESPLVLDAAGNLYGISPYAGDSSCGTEGLGCGTVYKVTQSGNLTLLHTFMGTDGIHPKGGLVRDTKGNLYGSALFGGNLACYSPASGNPPESGCGTVFKLGHSGSLTVLHTFTGQADGSTPLAVTKDQAGNLYGLAQYGGDLTCYAPAGCGTIFKVDTKGNFSVLYTFTSTVTRTPLYASYLVIDSKGNLYGAKQFDGSNNDGFLFKLDTSGNLTNLFNFPPGGSFLGSNALGVILDGKGGFYGSMQQGGPPLCGPPGSGEGCGTVFHLTF